MNIKLKYGRQSRELNIPDLNTGSVLRASEIQNDLYEETLIARSILSPIGCASVSKLFKKGEKVVIITSDITRPMPSYKVLPQLVYELNRVGIADSDITVVFGLGSHRKHTEDEKKKLAGNDIYDRIKCIDSDPDDVVSLGTTSRGTPVDIFRTVVEADKRICLGNIEYHYFAGYSGGYKAIMPGVSTFSAIQKNHSNMVKDGARAGNMTGNPVREDIEEVADFIKIDFLINVVLDEHKNIIGAFGGDPVLAHREGCRFLDRIYSCPLDEKADIVIVSPGGFPKDMNLYQAQKALDNSKHAVKDGGIIILVAECSEGLGGESFERWMEDFEKPEDMIEEIQRNFILGGHKAAAIGLILEKADICLVSAMPDDYVRKIFMEPFESPQKALDEALKRKGPDARVHIMPYGGSVLPLEKKQEER